jgi:Hg(II)-responsive transcriptional regulator
MGITHSLKIGEVAKRASVKVQTLRYYEQIGILRPVARRSSGYRLYDESAVKILHFIKQAQELGFSLNEIRALLSLRSSGKSKCAAVQSEAIRHLREIEAKVARLNRMRSALKRLIGRCKLRKSDLECPIIESLEG